MSGHAWPCHEPDDLVQCDTPCRLQARGCITASSHMLWRVGSRAQQWLWTTLMAKRNRSCITTTATPGDWRESLTWISRSRRPDCDRRDRRQMPCIWAIVRAIMTLGCATIQTLPSPRPCHHNVQRGGTAGSDALPSVKAAIADPKHDTTRRAALTYRLLMLA